MTPSQAGSSSDRPGPRDRRVPGHRSRPAHGGSDTQAGPGSCHQARNRALREPFIIVADQIQRDHERRCDPLVVVKRPRCIHRMQPHVRSGTFDRQPVLPNDQPEILAPDIAFELISTAYDINPDITQRAHPRPDHTGIEAQSRQSTRVGTKPEPVRPRADHTEMRHDPLRGAVPRPFQLLGRQPGSRAALNEPQHPPHRTRLPRPMRRLQPKPIENCLGDHIPSTNTVRLQPTRRDQLPDPQIGQPKPSRSVPDRHEHDITLSQPIEICRQPTERVPDNEYR